ncbi:MAG: peptidase M56 [Alphaproteobacteria bacterium]|nr:peptidase M56 [Alphaproteobacteria bacterium]MBU1515819.1 peptidase M56 [Alphaproteobacteria bacterium]MBU2094041.1 peptidase M56 [Alphaproteobacteria bacterium]MBU2151393.1 peptidase M56 [Alphaproteobacteria bacterium]MBU2308813.1 peptidase M56 [Alphaproteobacteria bacterium]
MPDALHVVLGAYPAATLTVALLKANLVAAVAILLVAVVRILARRAFGPAAAYQLWGLPPAAGLVTLFIEFARPHTDPAIFAISPAFIWAWAAGALAVAALFTVAQLRFLAQVRAGRGGPAVVGFISPVIVMPADDGHYTAEERDLIRAHEREHVARKDPRGAAFAALAQCLCWFNPVVHLAAYLIRLDQELACDAAVIRARPTARALYARTLLKTQLAGSALPLGCHWSPLGQHPLEVRISSLKRTSNTSSRASGGTFAAASVNAIRP